MYDNYPLTWFLIINRKLHLNLFSWMSSFAAEHLSLDIYLENFSRTAVVFYQGKLWRIIHTILYMSKRTFWIPKFYFCVAITVQYSPHNQHHFYVFRFLMSLYSIHWSICHFNYFNTRLFSSYYIISLCIYLPFYIDWSILHRNYIQGYFRCILTILCVQDFDLAAELIPILCEGAQPYKSSHAWGQTMKTIYSLHRLYWWLIIFNISMLVFILCSSLICKYITYCLILQIKWPFSPFTCHYVSFCFNPFILCYQD